MNWKTTLMEELMPVLNSYQSALHNLYHSNYYVNSSPTSVSESKEVSPRLEYTLEVIDEAAVAEPGLTYQISFLNFIFIAKLRTWIIKKHRGKVLKDINTHHHEEFIAKISKLKIRVKSTRISFESNDREALNQTLKEIATLIYGNYAKITLRMQGANKAEQQTLEKILAEAYLIVKNQKARQHYQFFATPHTDLTHYEYDEPSTASLDAYELASTAPAA